MPKFANVPYWQKLEWGSIQKASLDTMMLVEAVHQLQGRGLSSIQILNTWMERNIQPLGWRPSPKFEYQGLSQEISGADVELRIHLVTGLPLGDIPMGVTVEPYHQGNPRPEVSHDDLCWAPYFPLEASLLACSDPSCLCPDLQGFYFQPTSTP